MGIYDAQASRSTAHGHAGVDMASSTIRTEADDILRSGLETLLGRHGDVHIAGSCALGPVEGSG